MYSWFLPSFSYTGLAKLRQGCVCKETWDWFDPHSVFLHCGTARIPCTGQCKRSSCGTNVTEVLSRELPLPRASQALGPADRRLENWAFPKGRASKRGETQCRVVDSVCHLLSPRIIGSFFIAPLNSQDLGHQVSISTGRFYLQVHNFCTHSSSLQGWSLRPRSKPSPPACAIASTSISASSSLPVQKATVVALAWAINIQGA